MCKVLLRKPLSPADRKHRAQGAVMTPFSGSLTMRARQLMEGANLGNNSAGKIVSASTPEVSFMRLPVYEASRMKANI